MDGISNNLPPSYEQAMQGTASFVQQDLKQDDSMANLPKDQMIALIHNLTNARPTNPSITPNQARSTSVNNVQKNLNQPSSTTQSISSGVWDWMFGKSEPVVVATHTQPTSSQRPSKGTSIYTRPQVRERPPEVTHIDTRIKTSTNHRPRAPITRAPIQERPKTGTTDIYTRMTTDTTRYPRRIIVPTAPPLIAATVPQSTVEKNLQDVQERLSKLKDQITLRLHNNTQLKVRVQLPGESVNRLPICEGIEDVIKISSLLPTTLQTSLGVSTILELLEQEYPELTADMGLDDTKKIPKFVFSTPVPLNDEGKGNFFPEVEANGKIAYLAWDSSGSCLGKGFKETTCRILPKKGETFSGLALSQANLEGIEQATGISAHFLSSKVTIIGILITNSIQKEERKVIDENRDFCLAPMKRSRNCLASKSINHTSFGMLGVQGAKVSDDRKNLSDRQCKGLKTLFCLEIAPQFSSKEHPVNEDMLTMATEVLQQHLV